MTVKCCKRSGRLIVVNESCLSQWHATDDNWDMKMKLVTSANFKFCGKDVRYKVAVVVLVVLGDDVDVCLFVCLF